MKVVVHFFTEWELFKRRSIKAKNKNKIKMTTTIQPLRFIPFHEAKSAHSFRDIPPPPSPASLDYLHFDDE